MNQKYKVFIKYIVFITASDVKPHGALAKPPGKTVMEKSDMQPLRSVRKAAELLGISPWTVRAYIRDGKLRPVRIGRRVLLAEAELERFVAEGQQAPCGGRPAEEATQ